MDLKEGEIEKENRGDIVDKGSGVLLVFITWVGAVFASIVIFSLRTTTRYEGELFPSICILPFTFFGLPDVLFGIRNPPGPLLTASTFVAMVMNCAQLGAYVWLTALIAGARKKRTLIAMLALLIFLIILNFVSVSVGGRNIRYW